MFKKQTKTTDGLNELKHDLMFFKGLSFLFLLMLVVIFFTFSGLFAAMFYEVKIMNNNFNSVYQLIGAKLDALDRVVLPPASVK
jgi:hypothetical protein